jgi:hypothetical protein
VRRATGPAFVTSFVFWILQTRTPAQSSTFEYRYKSGRGSWHRPRGTTVRELTEAVRQVVGISFDERYRPRREGDSPALVADNALALRRIGWSPSIIFCRSSKRPGTGTQIAFQSNPPQIYPPIVRFLQIRYRAIRRSPRPKWAGTDSAIPTQTAYLDLIENSPFGGAGGFKPSCGGSESGGTFNEVNGHSECTMEFLTSSLMWTPLQCFRRSSCPSTDNTPASLPSADHC